ncbi:TonB-dependent receptor plug domain-containing protein [Alteraurantiacibacter palmitatis]|uniref:TonB-dependent receptor plug domain-containing protein n=1 Tax=Alteraurantiacibacter palmitatis TaxID=2054628 RepID=A0ABV7E6M0_9SPHN
MLKLKGNRAGMLLRSASLATIAVSSLAWSHGAIAQETADEDRADTIVVTGSRIAEVPVGSSATVLGRAEIETSAGVTIDRIIKELPQNFDLGVSENSRAQTGGSGNIVYGNTVNLRGIGPYATLVLIDGHRVVNNSRSTDPSVLPTLGVQRVEVVADGASAIYGSDAVAGVVNLIPRRNLDGLEMFARYGFADRADFDENAMGVAFGDMFDGGQFMVAYEHVRRSRLSGDDRDFFTADQTAFGGRDYRTTRCAPGTLVIGTTTYALPEQYTQANANAITAGTRNLCETNPGQDLFPRQEYKSANATFDYEIAPWVEIFADAFWSRRTFDRRAATPSVRLTVPQTNAFFVRPDFFTGTSYSIDYSFENDYPITGTTGYAKSWQVTPGLRFNLPGGWTAEALVGIGETRDFSGSYDGLNNAALNAALASSNPQTAFDPYGLGRTNPAVISGIFNQLFLAPTNGDLTVYEARVNGPLFELPGGTVAMAAGYERQEFDVALGTARGNPGTPITFRNFGRTVDSGYIEVLLPIFGAGNAVPGFEELTINAAVRHDSYSDAGKTTNPKIGINWMPTDGLTLRGSYGTSFRAPTLPEIYGNSNNLFGQNYTNPAGGANLLGFALSGQNLDLKPETATTWSVGADFDAVPNLRLSLTYFNVDYSNQVIANLSNLAILAQAADYEGTGVILRGTAAQQRVAQLLADGIVVLGTPIPGGNVANVDIFVDGRSRNLGKSITRGIDFAGSYLIDVSANDTLTLSASGTYLINYKVATTPTAATQDRLNQIFQPLKFKARVSAEWEHGPISARVLATHVGGYTNTAITPNEPVGSYTPIDLSVTYRFGQEMPGTLLEGLSITGEVRNVFDIDPPYVNLAPGGNGSGGYDATAASPIGRVFALGARLVF